MPVKNASNVAASKSINSAEIQSNLIIMSPFRH